jgi:hypothetical protein
MSASQVDGEPQVSVPHVVLSPIQEPPLEVHCASDTSKQDVPKQQAPTTASQGEVEHET